MQTTRTARIGEVLIGPKRPLALLAGPCVIESLEHCLFLAREIAGIAQQHGMPYVFKASYDKANRSSGGSKRGPGISEGLRVLAEVRDAVGVPVLSDVHDAEQARIAGEVLDCVQVPAFLCRQTDLLLACGGTRKCVNIKKGQFLAPEKIELAMKKVDSTGNTNVLLTERGTSFGYERLINDMTALEVMRRFAPVVFDATHSVQHPGGPGDNTSGTPQFVPLLARAAVAAGVDALFIEVHDRPKEAHSDAATVLDLKMLDGVLASCARIHAVVNGSR